MFEIYSSEKINTGFRKQIEFGYHGEAYRAVVSWDAEQGYAIVFTDQYGRWIATPEWYNKWDEEYDSVEYLLDEATDIHKVYEPKMCEMCDNNPPRTPESKWCDSCRDDFKESDSE